MCVLKCGVMGVALATTKLLAGAQLDHSLLLCSIEHIIDLVMIKCGDTHGYLHGPVVKLADQFIGK